ncbi:transglutaminase-like domain-containing protein [Tanticharoenia sakaeratensis]|jgi:transglutaminase-like putative cysteine protease|uniref:Transglutaminase domain-containing protein n=1 Tax=Tanticharoenia sakaeratensis NBRC 103193 TaxID=1231623 RepID=A0A0D6MK05_9PROT|nr:transglutaminase family protein [Tanticharoenia sakaeratensis]GAN54004.1 transglutaminase domain-containing protein [Tanticharoenia sakaeratensis NBRC 103193]GBQ23091.1 transglutaminase domain-containing protein [Tanticharoenia sakaeratensis NBRC 103193]
MLIRAGYDIGFATEHPTPLLLMLSVHPSREADLREPQTMVFDPPVPYHQYHDGFGNVCTRVTAPAGGLRVRADFVVADTGLPDLHAPDARQMPVEDLPDEVLVFLLGSRYCETDRLSDMAWALFGDIEPGWARVQAIVDYAHERIRFSYAHARPTRTAFEGNDERIGVCRDFAHLAVTLCRCMNIPARYCTGYLGDIGVPPVDDPMDFSAWFDVYLGGQWYTFDARHNRPRIGRILMARGRDATDVAISTAFGQAILSKFDVTTYELPSD